MRLAQRIERASLLAQEALVARVCAMPLDELIAFLRDSCWGQCRITVVQDAAVKARARSMNRDDARPIFRGVYAGISPAERKGHMARMLPTRAADPERWARFLAMIWPEEEED